MTNATEVSEITAIKNWLGSGSINIFGLPFSGKDTQARRIGQLLDAPVIGGGDILRNHSDQDKIKALMATGELFPTDFYLDVVLPYLGQPALAGKPLILSSVGRWEGEESVIEAAAKKAGHPIKAVVRIVLEEKEVRKRFNKIHEIGDRGLRHDDAEHLIDTRITEFRTKTMPVLEFYRQKGLLIEVDGHGDPESVTRKIVHKLKDLIQ